MKIQHKIIIYLVLLLLFLALSFIGGCLHGKKVKDCPVINADTILIYDTIDHIIIHDHYTVTTDTIIINDTILTDVDTAAILIDYFAYHIYQRKWIDSLIRITISDTISQNKPIGNTLVYNLLRPKTVINNTIDNSITYDSYISIGADLPLNSLNDIEVNAMLIRSRFNVGAGYQPVNKIITLKAGYNLFKLKAARDRGVLK